MKSKTVLHYRPTVYKISLNNTVGKLFRIIQTTFQTDIFIWIYYLLTIKFHFPIWHLNNGERKYSSLFQRSRASKIKSILNEQGNGCNIRGEAGGGGGGGGLLIQKGVYLSRQTPAPFTSNSPHNFWNKYNDEVSGC